MCFAGENLNFLKRTISYANQHYPERSYAIFIVNAPMFFSLLWRIVKPLVHENTQKKVRILSRADTLKGLQEVHGVLCHPLEHCPMDIVVPR